MPQNPRPLPLRPAPKKGELRLKATNLLLWSVSEKCAAKAGSADRRICGPRHFSVCPGDKPSDRSTIDKKEPQTATAVDCASSPQSGRRPLAHGESAVGQCAGGRIDKPRRGDVRLRSRRIEYDRLRVVAQKKPHTAPPRLTILQRRQHPTAGSPWAKGHRRSAAWNLRCALA